MKRSLNNSMRKMAVTGLALIGMILGSLGASGCDERSADQIAQLTGPSGAASVQVADSKAVARSAIGPMYRR